MYGRHRLAPSSGSFRHSPDDGASVPYLRTDNLPIGGSSKPVSVRILMYFKARSHSPNPNCRRRRVRRTKGVVIANIAMVSRREAAGPLETPEEYSDYRIFDREGLEIGRVKELFVCADDEVRYLEVKTGLLGLQSVLIPIGLVTVDDERQVLLLR
jgi:hypothetical protein